MTRFVRNWVGAIVLATALAAVSEVNAQSVPLKADLKGTNHVPPIQVPGSGNVVATLDPATRTLRWTITYSGLSGPPIAMHFHGPADTTRNAGIAVPITGNFASPITGFSTLTESWAKDLLAGRWYVNIHTAAHPAGELRGQVTIDTGSAGVPTQPASERSTQEAASRAAAERAAQAAAAKAAADKAAQEAGAKAATDRALQEAAAKAAADRATREAAAKAAAERVAQEAAAERAAQQPAIKIPSASATQQLAAKPPKPTSDESACQKDLSTALANETLVFKTASARIRVSEALVNKLKAIVARCPAVQLEVAGHTDSIGSEDLNKSLSQRRAQAFVDNLVKAGIDRAKLVAIGYGSSKPAASNDNAEGRSRNRRIEFVLR
jgi:outer membrane protein OmpA-like peptidoglycan-associated protein